MSQKYDDNFFSSIDGGSLASAEVCVPIFKRLLDFNNVADIGSGTGAWSLMFSNQGCKVTAIDGRYAELNYEKYTTDDFSINFTPKNLEDVGSLKSVPSHDLLISLEVAEHLSADRASSFVEELCNISNQIIFSAAIPYQGGTGHVNENWLQYWVKLFAQNHFKYFDPFRRLLWNNPKVKWWYKQNLCLFVQEDHIDSLDNNFVPVELEEVISMVHPEMYIWAIHRGNKEINNSYGKDSSYYRNILSLDFDGIYSAYGSEFS
ncbi:hypothetical protein MAH1_35130 [Sessilibacter sp. MAH1]